MTDLEAKAREIADARSYDVDWADMIATALREARNQALDEAAVVADAISDGLAFPEDIVADNIAARIRSLKGK